MGKKNVEVERLTNEVTCLLDDCLFRLGSDVVKMGEFVEKMKKLKKEVQDEVPNAPSGKTADVIGEHFAISKPEKKTVNNPTKASNKGNISEAERNKRRKSEREKALTIKKKQMKPCRHCGEKTNSHTKTTCPLNPKARRKAPHNRLQSGVDNPSGSGLGVEVGVGTGSMVGQAVQVNVVAREADKVNPNGSDIIVKVGGSGPSEPTSVD